MPVLLFEIGFTGPTTEHIGNALWRHIDAKSPKPMASWPFPGKGSGEEASLLGAGVGGSQVKMQRRCIVRNA